MIMTERSYCDHNALSPLHPKALQVMEEQWRLPLGNPSSLHREGQRAQAALAKARELLALNLDCHKDEIFFVSSSSEANTTVMEMFQVSDNGRNGIIASEIEHDSIHLHPNVTSVVKVNLQGVIDFHSLGESIERYEPQLLTCHAAHNETGVIQSLGSIQHAVQKHQIFWHADLSQYCGRMPFSFRESGLDFATIASHKIGGPVGIAALLIRRGRPSHRLIWGGGQESGFRAGTESVPLALAFAHALDMASRDAELWQRLRELRDALAEGLKVCHPETIIVGEQAPRLPNTLTWLVEGKPAQSTLIRFDQDGIALSSGSACGAGLREEPRTLLRMGYPIELATTALRASFGWNTTKEDIESILRVWQKICA